MNKYTRLPLTIAKNYFSFVKFPSYCTFLVTWKCNCRCNFCEIWKKKSGNELSAAEIKQIFKQLKKMDAVRITGGEPFLRTDLLEITDAINCYVNPDIIHITTNGVLTERIVEYVRQSAYANKKLHIKVSVDAIGERHDKNRGVPGVFAKAINTIAALEKYVADNKIILGVNMSMFDRDSFRDYAELKELLKKMGVKIYPAIAFKTPALYRQEDEIKNVPTNTMGFEPYFDFSNEELKEIFAILEEDSAEIGDFIGKMAVRYDLEGAKNRIMHNNPTPNPRCVALNDHLRLLPDGSVPVCYFDSRIVGNMRDTPFRKLWFDSQDTREKRNSVKHCKGCWVACETVPNSVYTGNMFKFLLKSLICPVKKE